MVCTRKCVMCEDVCGVVHVMCVWYVCAVCVCGECAWCVCVVGEIGVRVCVCVRHVPYTLASTMYFYI